MSWVEDAAREARVVYWSSIDRLDKAEVDPSPESLKAWMLVVDSVRDSVTRHERGLG